jgi:hypothetical protein
MFESAASPLEKVEQSHAAGAENCRFREPVPAPSATRYSSPKFGIPALAFDPTS